MPWTCLAGEPENINWCNAEDSMLRYHNPPDAWKGARDKGESTSLPSSPCPQPPFAPRHLSSLRLTFDECLLVQCLFCGMRSCGTIVKRD